MPKTNITNHSRGIRRVAIDGHFLDDVQIRLHSDESSKSLSYSSAPVDFSILWPKFQQSMANDPPKSEVELLGLGI